MRGPFLFLVLGAAGPVAAQSKADAVLDDLVRHEREAHAGLLRSGDEGGRGFDMRYARCAWDLDPAVRAITGTVTSYFVTTDAIDHITFDLSQALTVDATLYHGVALPFEQTTDDRLMIELPAVLPAGTLDSISVSYHGVPPDAGTGSFVTAEHAGTPVLWTLSEPYGAKDWWPCKQDLRDKIDSLDLYVTTPSAYRAAGNGVLAAATELEGRTTYHWRHRYPIDHYLVATAVTNYVVDTQYVVLPDVTVPMISYAYPEDAFMAGLNAGDVLQQMPLYSQLFGTYPFATEKYGHAQFGWGGGMEHQTMSFMGYYHYELAAHELAHQWFGDKVTCGSWQDLWLNEGFASYLTGLCYEHLAPMYWAGWKQARIATITSEPDGSVRCLDTLDQARLFSNRLTYNKGAMVLHMLRWICGDAAFYHGVRSYLDDPGLAYGTARTSDLQHHLETSSDKDLSGFFADWYIGEGYPSYVIQWAQDGSGQVELAMHQTSSHPSVDFFELPVPIRFSDGVLDSTVVLDNTQDDQTFTFHLPFLAQQADLDPESWLVTAHNILAQVPSLDRDSWGLIIYPNPAEDRIGWRTDGPTGSPVRAKIFDAVGKVIADVTTLDASLPLYGMAAGTYVLEIARGDRTLRSTFVKR